MEYLQTACHPETVQQSRPAAPQPASIEQHATAHGRLQAVRQTQRMSEANTAVTNMQNAVRSTHRVHAMWHMSHMAHLCGAGKHITTLRRHAPSEAVAARVLTAHSPSVAHPALSRTLLLPLLRHCRLPLCGSGSMSAVQQSRPARRRDTHKSNDIMSEWSNLSGVQPGYTTTTAGACVGNTYPGLCCSGSGQSAA